MTIEQIMDVFDSESDILRGYIRSAVSAEFDRHLSRVTRLLSRKLREPSPGSDWGTRALRWVEQCSGASPERLVRLVEETWQEAWDAGPDAACRGCARDAARRRWEIVWPEFDNDGGTVLATRTAPAMAFAMNGPFLEIACPALTMEAADSGGLAQRVAEAQSRYEQIRSALGLMLGNEELRKGDLDLVASVADLGTVALAARDAGDLADSAGALAMPGLTAAVGIGAVAAAVADVGSASMAQRERIAFGHLAACRVAAQREFLREVDEFLAYARGIMYARAYHVYSAGGAPERMIRIRQGISELMELGDKMLQVSETDQLLCAETSVARVFMGVMGRILVTRDDEEIGLTPTTRRVLLRLAAASPRTVTAEQIYRDVWGAAPAGQQAQRRARGQVQKCVHESRRKLGENLVLTEDAGYRLDVDGDWLRFGRLVADGADAEPIIAARLFDRALEMWPECLAPDVPSDLAGRLSDLREAALRGAGEAYRKLGDLDTALRYAETLRSDDGLAESVRQEARDATDRGDLVQRAFPELGVVLTIRKGNLFEQDDANLAIGFGDTFDTNTDQDKIISRDSVQGQFLRNCYDGDHVRLDEDLADELDKLCPAVSEELNDKPRGKRTRYVIGTTVTLTLPSDDRRRVFAFAHCRQDDGYVTRSTPEDLDAALTGLWSAARRRDMYKPLAVPVVGSGAARVRGLNRTGLITTIIASFLGSCLENGRCANGLRIVVPSSDLALTGIDEIRRYVRELDADGRGPS